ncbi:MAG: hypothetical protein ACI9R3_005130, partial [Verrucomicrobiales bacterium]
DLITETRLRQAVKAACRVHFPEYLLRIPEITDS